MTGITTETSTKRKTIWKAFLLTVVLVCLGCSESEEQSPSAAILLNDLPAGGPTFQITDGHIGQSSEDILAWLEKPEHRERFSSSLAWLQLESSAKIEDVQGLTAKELVDFANARKGALLAQ